MHKCPACRGRGVSRSNPNKGCATCSARGIVSDKVFRRWFAETVEKQEERRERYKGFLNRAVIVR